MRMKVIENVNDQQRKHMEKCRPQEQRKLTDNCCCVWILFGGFERKPINFMLYVANTTKNGLV